MERRLFWGGGGGDGNHFEAWLSNQGKKQKETTTELRRRKRERLVRTILCKWKSLRLTHLIWVLGCNLWNVKWLIISVYDFSVQAIFYSLSDLIVYIPWEDKLKKTLFVSPNVGDIKSELFIVLLHYSLLFSSVASNNYQRQDCGHVPDTLSRNLKKCKWLFVNWLFGSWKVCFRSWEIYFTTYGLLRCKPRRKIEIYLFLRPCCFWGRRLSTVPRAEIFFCRVSVQWNYLYVLGEKQGKSGCKGIEKNTNLIS